MSVISAATAGPATATFLRQLLSDERFASEKRLQRFGWRAFSSSDQDGMIAEVFRRIGTTNRCFAEFGVDARRGCNTAYLLACGWTGTWALADTPDTEAASIDYGTAISDGRLRVIPATTASSDADLLAREIASTGELDLLSFDADGNEYAVLDRLPSAAARVVVVPYNASYRPPVRWIATDDPQVTQGRTHQRGASLSAHENVMRRRGYALVGCNLAGSDAIFVRKDLVSTYFEPPFTAETHYEPPRPYLASALKAVSGLRSHAGPATVVITAQAASPTTEMIHRATGQLNREAFEESAICSAVDVETALGRAKLLSPVRSILDFGCGCGRLAQVLTSRFPDATFVGTDIDEEAILWLRTVLASATFVVNDHLPPLPFADENFDFVYGWSVFSHLNEAYQDAWLSELRRVTTRGGTVLLTVCGQLSWEAIVEQSNHPRREELLALRDRWLRNGILFWADDGWEDYFPDFYHTTFHTAQYIRERWSRWFDIVEVVPGGAGRIEDMVILRRSH